MKIEGNVDEVYQVVRILRWEYEICTNDDDGNYSFLRSDNYPDLHLQVKIIDNGLKVT